MAFKVGRNDPCPCGSGRKYKQCCMLASGPTVASTLMEARRLEAALIPTVFDWATRELPPAVIEEAVGEFLGDSKDRRASVIGDESILFHSWLATHWTIHMPGSGKKRDALPGLLAAIVARALAGRGPTGDEQAFAEALLAAPYSFYQVRAVEPGRGMTLRDVLIESEVSILEIAASAQLRPGDLLYGQVVVWKSVSMMVGRGILAIPPDEIDTLIGLRKSFKPIFRKMTRNRLDEIEPQLRELYLMFRDRIMNPPPPVLHNTDGDPLRMITLTWKVTLGASDTIRLLAPLNVAAPDEIPEPGGDGLQPDETEISWCKLGNKKIKTWQNTILGRLIVSPGRIKAEVNSRKRMEVLKNEIAARLGLGAHLDSTEDLSFEEASARDRTSGRKTQSPGAQRSATGQPPEIRQMMLEMTREWERTWPDEKLPALGGLTPRQATKTPEGRERLESLLWTIEREGRMAAGLPPPDWKAIRKTLGIP